jgi:transposase
MRLRKLITLKLPSYEFNYKVKVNEIYFGRVRKGKRGRGRKFVANYFGTIS